MVLYGLSECPHGKMAKDLIKSKGLEAHLVDYDLLADTPSDRANIVAALELITDQDTVP